MAQRRHSGEQPESDRCYGARERQLSVVSGFSACGQLLLGHGLAHPYVGLAHGDTTMRSAYSSDQGQALIVVALCIAVLIGGLALAVDWGYAMVERRGMQSLADASAMGAGKRLATAVTKVNGAIQFSVTQEQTWCAADQYANPLDLKRSFAPSTTTNQLALFYGDGSSPTVWTTGATTCTGSTEVPPSTIY